MQILTIAGNVGKDPVLRRTQGGDPVLNFSLAVDNGKDKDGNKRDATWFDCSIWGKRAESLEPHIHKGDKLAISGRPTTRAHDSKAYLGINVNDLTFQGGKQDDSNRQGSPDSSNYGGGAGGGYGTGGAGGSDMEDGIPFGMEWRA